MCTFSIVIVRLYVCLIIFPQEVASGAAQTTLETLQEILQELSQTNETHGHGYSDAGKKILGSLKSTMSDRASSQKAFNTLLSEYRAEVLPQVVSNWDSMSKEEQQSMSQMYNFFCGMHLVVNSVVARPFFKGLEPF